MASKELIAAVCPNCNANIELDKNFESGFCTYCGTKIIIKDVVKKIKILNQPTAENYLILGNREYDNGYYQKALEYYEKILQIDAECEEAIYKKGLCLVIINSPNASSLKALNDACEDSMEVLMSQHLEKEKLDQIKVDMAYDLSKIVDEKYEQASRTTFSSVYLINECAALFIQLLEKAIDYAKSTGNDSLKGSNNYSVKEICNQCYVTIVNICVDVCNNNSKYMLNCAYYVSTYENYRNLLRIKLPNYQALLLGYPRKK